MFLKKIPKIYGFLSKSKKEFVCFASKNLVDVAKINLEIEKILPMTELMRQSSLHREEICKIFIRLF